MALERDGAFPARHSPWHDTGISELTVGARAHHAQTASIVLVLRSRGSVFIAKSLLSVSADFAGEFAGVTSGIMNMGCQIGGAVTASLTPVIASHFGWETSFLAATILAPGCRCYGSRLILTPGLRKLSFPSGRWRAPDQNAPVSSSLLFLLHDRGPA